MCNLCCQIWSIWDIIAKKKKKKVYMCAVVKHDKTSELDRNDRQTWSRLQHTLFRKGSIKYCLLLLWARLKILHLTMRSHRTRRERQSGRKSFIFNESRRRALASAARFGWWERRGELKSGQRYGNELWRGWAATNQNVEVLRLKGFQRMQHCKLWFWPH